MAAIFAVTAKSKPSAPRASSFAAVRARGQIRAPEVPDRETAADRGEHAHVGVPPGRRLHQGEARLRERPRRDHQLLAGRTRRRPDHVLREPIVEEIEREAELEAALEGRAGDARTRRPATCPRRARGCRRRCRPDTRNEPGPRRCWRGGAGSGVATTGCAADGPGAGGGGAGVAATGAGAAAAGAVVGPEPRPPGPGRPPGPRAPVRLAPTTRRAVRPRASGAA